MNANCPEELASGWYSESVKHSTWGVRRQRWNSKELTGARTSGGTCGLIRWYARNLTRAQTTGEYAWKRIASNSRCRGAAWLSSARAVRCRLKCHNERNPCLQLLTVKLRTLEGLPAQAVRKDGMTSNQHGPYVRGDTRVTMVGTAGSHMVT